MYQVTIQYKDGKIRPVFTSESQVDAESEAAYLQHMLGNDVLSVNCDEVPKLAEMSESYDRN